MRVVAAYHKAALCITAKFGGQCLSWVDAVEKGFESGPRICAFGVDALLILPKILEPIRRQCSVAHGGLDRSVSEIGLDCTSVLPIGSKLEAAPVTQHVAVDQKAEPGGLASAGNHPLIACHAERRTTF